jgi:phage replication-related protein YjqB (UPF0714/DUF867 family)
MDLEDLLHEPGVEERCVLRSAVGFLALHGGSQDRGTDLIAGRAADRVGASYYAIIQPPRLRIHISSRHLDPTQSSAMQSFLAHVDVAISVHGFGRDGFGFWLNGDGHLLVEPYGPPLKPGQRGPLQGVIIGGRNEALLVEARAVFERRLDGFRVADGRVRLGFHRDNPANLPRNHGVQIELPPALRGIGPLGDQLTPDRDDPLVADVVDALVELATFAATLPAPVSADAEA